MKWYYSIRGNVEQHGVADDAQLADLIRRGSLRSSDLVCSETTGNRWIPVSALNNPQGQASPPPLRLEPREQATEAARHPCGWLRVVGIILALAAAGLGVLLLRAVLRR